MENFARFLLYNNNQGKENKLEGRENKRRYLNTKIIIPLFMLQLWPDETRRLERQAPAIMQGMTMKKG